jgi:protein-S-isoprenylcysteine O-methyltransferase Ste14
MDRSARAGANSMKLAGLLLLPAGWLLVVCALVLLVSSVPRGAFVFAGIGVEILGLVLLVRAHLGARGDHE